jgi:hypothetical protein
MLSRYLVQRPFESSKLLSCFHTASPFQLYEPIHEMKERGGGNQVICKYRHSANIPRLPETCHPLQACPDRTQYLQSSVVSLSQPQSQANSCAHKTPQASSPVFKRLYRSNQSPVMNLKHVLAICIRSHSL